MFVARRDVGYVPVRRVSEYTHTTVVGAVVFVRSPVTMSNILTLPKKRQVEHSSVLADMRCLI